MDGYQRTPEGLLCVNDMPSAGERWVPRRKALVVAGLRSGLISEADACERYGLTREELVEWMARYDSGGRPGLRVTRRPKGRSEERPSADGLCFARSARA